MDVLWQRVCADFDAVFDEFVSDEFVSTGPTDTTRATRVELMIVFQMYYVTHRDALENNVNVLSKLATVFAGQHEYVNEYKVICVMIRDILGRADTRV